MPVFIGCYKKNEIEGERAVDLGSEVHRIAQRLLQGEKPGYEKELAPYVSNLNDLLIQIRKDYPECMSVEKKLKISLEELIGKEGEGMFFVGKLDAVFKNGEKHLIVDWKTSMRAENNSEHRQQLAAYRSAYSVSESVPLENIKVALGYVGLRERVNTGKIGATLDDKQPVKSAFETFRGHVSRLLKWKSNPEIFLEELMDQQKDELLWKSIAEEYHKGS